MSSKSSSPLGKGIYIVFYVFINGLVGALLLGLTALFTNFTRPLFSRPTVDFFLRLSIFGIPLSEVSARVWAVLGLLLLYFLIRWLITSWKDGEQRPGWPGIARSGFYGAFALIYCLALVLLVGYLLDWKDVKALLPRF